MKQQTTWLVVGLMFLLLTTHSGGDDGLQLQPVPPPSEPPAFNLSGTWYPTGIAFCEGNVEAGDLQALFGGIEDKIDQVPVGQLQEFINHLEDSFADYRSFDITQTESEIIFHDPDTDRHLYGSISGAQLHFDQQALHDEEVGITATLTVEGTVLNASQLTLVEIIDFESSDGTNAYRIFCTSEIAR